MLISKPRHVTSICFLRVRFQAVLITALWRFCFVSWCLVEPGVMHSVLLFGFGLVLGSAGGQITVSENYDTPNGGIQATAVKFVLALNPTMRGVFSCAVVHLRHYRSIGRAENAVVKQQAFMQYAFARLLALVPQKNHPALLRDCGFRPEVYSAVERQVSTYVDVREVPLWTNELFKKLARELLPTLLATKVLKEGLPFEEVRLCASFFTLPASCFVYAAALCLQKYRSCL